MKLIHELFEEQVTKTPENIALVFETTRVTYSDLNRRANRLAHRLRSGGVGKDTLVGICMQRSIEMFVAIWGVLKAGGGYVPLDPMYPQDRLAFLMEDSGIQTLLAQRAIASQLPATTAAVIWMDERTDNAGEADDNLQADISGHDLAYMVYTSGSTGKPKGVMIEHRNVMHLVRAMLEVIPYESGRRMLCVNTMSFDLFLTETLLPLCQGIPLIIANTEEQRDAKLLNALLLRESVDMIQSTPSRLHMFINDPSHLSTLSGVRAILTGGEALPLSLLKTLQQLQGASIFNLYGPTEATVWSTVQDVTQASRVTIGKPLLNTRVYIVDESGQQTSYGEIGELCISGEGVARGYHNRPELNEERFIPDPFAPEAGGLMYRTGDLARFLEDGAIDFIGRNDNQLKLRGFRIELGEIEAHLAEHPAVEQCVSVVREDAPGNPALVAYYTSAQDAPLASSELRAFLTQKLPEFMVPSSFVRLDKLPLSFNGKIDRNALPKPSMSRLSLQQPYLRPSSPIEEELASIWAAVLNYDAVGAEDDFIDLGGHSLLATQVITRIDQSFQVQISLREMLTAGHTVKGLSELVEQRLLAQISDLEAEALLRELEELSDEEVEKLLLK